MSVRRAAAMFLILVLGGVTLFELAQLQLLRAALAFVLMVGVFRWESGEYDEIIRRRFGRGGKGQ